MFAFMSVEGQTSSGMESAKLLSNLHHDPPKSLMLYCDLMSHASCSCSIYISFTKISFTADGQILKMSKKSIKKEIITHVMFVSHLLDMALTSSTPLSSLLHLGSSSISQRLFLPSRPAFACLVHARVQVSFHTCLVKWSIRGNEPWRELNLTLRTAWVFVVSAPFTEVGIINIWIMSDSTHEVSLENGNWLGKMVKFEALHPWVHPPANQSYPTHFASFCNGPPLVFAGTAIFGVFWCTSCSGTERGCGRALG